MNNSKDRKRLTAAAMAINHDLRRQNLDTSFRLKSDRIIRDQVNENENETETGGWYITLATWGPNRPRVKLWLDKFLRGGIREYSFGFTSDDEKIIKSLVDQLPGKFQPKRSFEENKDVKEENGIWVMKKRPSKMTVANACTESWRSVGSFHFGIYNFGYDMNSLRQRAVKFIGEVVNLVSPKTLNIENDIAELTARRNLTKTSQNRLIQARLGQGQFRRDMFKIWQCCAVTGCRIAEVLRASHIRPWSKSSDHQRLDPENGLLLTATLDALFDEGLISFDDAGHMLFARSLKPTDRELLMIKGRLNRKLSVQQKRYLKFHRRSVFKLT